MYWIYNDWPSPGRIYRVTEYELMHYWEQYDFDRTIVFKAELVME